MNYQLTVILLSYNQAKYIKQAIESVLAQKTTFNFQLIITDDHSTEDNSVEIIKYYQNRFPDIIKTIFSNKNGRTLENTLRAKSITKTDYFCLLDADDYWVDQYKLQKAYDFLENNKDYVIYSTNTMCLYEDSRTEIYMNYPLIEERSFCLEDYYNNDIIITCTLGTVFRNVIFKHGIPEFMSKAINTSSERSFEADFCRYLMHLKYGKAKFINHIDGVYRILQAGIWTRLSDFEKNILSAKAVSDHLVFLGKEGKDTCYAKAYFYLSLAIDNLHDLVYSKDRICITDKNKRIFFEVFETCQEYKECIKNIEQKKPSEQISILNQVIAERDQVIAERNQVIAECDKQIDMLDQALNQALNQAIVEHDKKVIAIYNSASWKITKPLRYISRVMKFIRRIAWGV